MKAAAEPQFICAGGLAGFTFDVEGYATLKDAEARSKAQMAQARQPEWIERVYALVLVKEQRRQADGTVKVELYDISALPDSARGT